MNTVIEFLSMRPVFTRSALQGIWYLYLTATVLQLAQDTTFLVSPGQLYPQGLAPHYYISLLAPILFALAHLALVRIFLEMALQFIAKRTLSV